MTTPSTQPEIERRIAELESRKRGAWWAYREDLRGLDAITYDDTEPASWKRLQATLRELEAERAQIVASVLAR